MRACEYVRALASPVEWRVEIRDICVLAMTRNDVDDVMMCNGINLTNINA